MITAAATIPIAGMPGIKFKASVTAAPRCPPSWRKSKQELAIVLGDVHKEGRSAGVPKAAACARCCIQSIDVLAPYLDTVEKLVDWEKLRAAKLRFVSRSHVITARRAACWPR